MQEINERILRIIKHYCGGNKTKFAIMMGEKPQTISSWCTRKIGRGVTDKILDKLPEIRESWLLTGEGDMLKSDVDRHGLVNTDNAHDKISGLVAGTSGSTATGLIGAAGFAAAINPMLSGISSSLLKILSQYDEALSAERNMREKGEIENIRIKSENEQLKLEIEELKSKLQ